MRILLVLLFACGATSHGARPKPTTGTIAGLVRDTKTGEGLALVELRVAGQAVKSNENGIYQLDNVAPGKHTLHATFADQPITIHNIEVVRGMATFVDVPFTLGEPSAIVIDWANAREDEIQTFTTKVPRIEGTVGDANTRARVGGAVVTAAQGPEDETLQTVTDDHGRYRFDAVRPGTYAISAYYSIGGRAQIEVRRSDVIVEQGKGVFVPLWIDLAK